MKNWIYSLLVIVLSLVSGCLVTERKSLVMIIPAKSNEIHVCYAFEGISVENHGSLKNAAFELKDMQGENFSFFLPAETLKRTLPKTKNFADQNPEDSPLNYCRFEKLRFFVNSERKRPLCADRRMTITDRTKFENSLNRMLKAEFGVSNARLSEEKALKKLRESNARMFDEETREVMESMGMGALYKIAIVISEMYVDLDMASFRRINEAANVDFRWVRIEEGSISLAIPVTGEFAKSIVANPKSPKWLEELGNLVRPVEYNATEEGLMITAGKPGTPVRLTYEDSRGYSPELEKELLNHAGSLEKLRIKGRSATAENLIEEFLELHQ